MNFSLIVGLTLVLLIIAFFRLRAEHRRVRLIDSFITWPGTIVLLIYAWFYSHWLELIVAAVITGLIVLGWWIVYGSYLPPPTSDNITVWRQETKKPSVVAAEAQAEVERLKQEKETLEQELKRLKKEQGDGKEG